MDWNIVGLIVLALVNAYNAYMTQRTHTAVMVVEKATNSMKDALVASTDKASRAEGELKGRSDQRQETLAE